MLVKKIDEKKLNDEEKKLRAVYALNMCTVSVSQIVDYDDVNVLEQEYDAILNNLNLEIIPKDAPLLKILKQILDVITFFRIEEREKEIIEKEYQQKMKEAIWASAPQLGMIVAGGNPITMAISLASQVGIGYMNYRRNKNQYGLEKDQQNWQLEKSAIEQLNGLRRELFDTAWNMADAYGFKDEFRLTEKQIKQYNWILQDQNELRKFERLEAIKESFEAYPPFWYFIGNSANYLSSDMGFSENERFKFKKKAKEYFEHFFELNKFNILRHDQLTAACALEYAELLMDENGSEKDILDLLSEAKNYSGNSFDVLQLCSIDYLRIGQKSFAMPILKMLVNESYNESVNAQMLSGLYIDMNELGEYEILKKRVTDKSSIYPLPGSGEDFESNQKEVLKTKYRIVVESFLEQYSIKFNKKTSYFVLNKQYKESFFSDRAEKERIAAARMTICNSKRKDNYLEWLAEKNVPLLLLEICNEMSERLYTLPFFEDMILKNKVTSSVKNSILEKKNMIIKNQEAAEKRSFTVDSYIEMQGYSIGHIWKNAKDELLWIINLKIDSASIEKLPCLESHLMKFCISENITMPSVIQKETIEEKQEERVTTLFTPDIFGPDYVDIQNFKDFLADMAGYVRNEMSQIPLKNDSVIIKFKNETGFDDYFTDSAFKNDSAVISHALAVIQDKTNKRFDLIFTTSGIVPMIKYKLKGLYQYKRVKFDVRSNKLIFGKLKYENDCFDTSKLYDLIVEIGVHFINDITDRIDKVEELNGGLLADWFEDRAEAMQKDVTKVVSYPTDKLLMSLGYYIEEALDPDKYVLQFYYKERKVLGLRVIEYESIETNLKIMLKDEGFIVL